MIWRHEWKHEISPLDRLVLRQRLGAVCTLDPHAQDGSYAIRSLYFDNVYDRALREKLDGVDRREKWRIRYYNGDTSLIHLERKAKAHGLGKKDACELTEAEARSIVDGNVDWMAKDAREEVRKLHVAMTCQGMRPKTIVDYTREPYLFGNAKTTVTKADKTRLINALKKLSLGEDLESVLDTEEVLRYFVVHDFVCNGDSYTGTMVHNYYLHESNGRLSMIPWDYNLAFGGFTGGDATTLVNAPIDSPTSSGLGGMPAGMSWGSESSDSRPMVDWIFSNEAYTARYHELYQEFLDSTDFATLIDTTKAMIADYVERDPTKFCTTEEFEKGVSALKEFCILRAQSVQGQLDGTIPSTEEGQRADSSSLVDASALTISDMGSMGMGGGPGNMPGNANDDASSGEPNEQGGGSFAPPDFGDFDPSGFAPGDFDPSGSAPNSFDPTSQGGPSQGEANRQRPGRGDFEPGGFDPRSTDVAAPGVKTQSLAILGASLAILALGFGATFIFRRP